jgi:MFS family permease
MIALISLIFIKVESQAQAPLFDLNLLKIRNFWAGNLAGFFNFVAYSSLVYIMPFYLEKILKRSPDQTGLYMTAIPLTILVVAPISGRISDRIGSRGLSVIGASIGALGLFAMAGLFGPGIGDHAHGPAIILGLCSMGLATGLFQSPNNNAIMGSVPTDKLGVASALLATVRNLGLATGTGTASVLFAWRESVTGNFISAMHTTFYFAGLFAMAAVLASYGKSKKMDLSS